MGGVDTAQPELLGFGPLPVQLFSVEIGPSTDTVIASRDFGHATAAARTPCKSSSQQSFFAQYFDLE